MCEFFVNVYLSRGAFAEHALLFLSDTLLHVHIMTHSQFGAAQHSRGPLLVTVEQPLQLLGFNFTQWHLDG